MYVTCKSVLFSFKNIAAKNLEPLGQSAEMAFKKYTEKDTSLFKKLQENRTEQEELQQRLNALKEHERQMEEESETHEKADIVSISPGPPQWIRFMSACGPV